MGGIWSRIRGKKTTYEILEGIDKDINRLQKSRKDHQDSQKRVVTRLIIYSVVLYIIAALIFFLLYFPDTWQLRLLYSTPLLVFPVVIWGLKRLLHWYFVSRIAKKDLALRDLREKKKQMLEDVMETETYKKAKEILEKFDPARFKKLEYEPEDTSGGSDNEKPESQNDISVNNASKPVSGTPGTAMQHRHTPRPVVSRPATPVRQPVASAVPRALIPSMMPRLPAGTPRPMGVVTPARGPVPIRGRGTPQLQQRMSMQQPTPQAAVRAFAPQPGPPMPRTVLPRDRGTMDRLMDYLVGDGPENRFALICQQCHSHNGMALKEEFEYLNFRCCYCYFLNPARKQRPFAPRMEFFTPLSKGRPVQGVKDKDESDDDEDDDGSCSSEDGEGSRDDMTGKLQPAAKNTQDSNKSSVKPADRQGTVSVKPSGIPLKNATKPEVSGGVSHNGKVVEEVSGEKGVSDMTDDDISVKAESVSDDSGNPDVDNGNPDVDNGNPDVDNGNPDVDIDRDVGNPEAEVSPNISSMEWAESSSQEVEGDKTSGDPSTKTELAEGQDEEQN